MWLPNYLGGPFPNSQHVIQFDLLVVNINHTLYTR